MSDEDLEFWNKAGSQIVMQEELITLLNACQNNDFTLVDGMIQSRDGTNCASLRFRQKERGTVHIYCQECGIVCPVQLADEEAVFPTAEAEDGDDELDEFLSIAGSEVIEDEGQWYDDDGGQSGENGELLPPTVAPESDPTSY